MSPEFASAVDPIFLHVLSTMEQVAANQQVDAQQLHFELQTQLRQAEERLQLGGQKEVWDLARYALCAWIDDLMITRTWEGQQWWENHKLEFQFFKTNEAGTGFFQRARQAEQLMQRDAIEVFYIAVILGFRGLYALPESNFLAQQFGLPNTIEDWTRRTAGLLQHRTDRPPLNGVSLPVRGAPPLESRFTVVGAALAMLMLLVLTGLLGYHILLGGSS
ncbi:MAG: DotU family type IV/VI secretion system protein [Planctomycetales bacterium]|nr:DotU family type IV/VI secretion system protein [Planctomycetales bacterium]